MAPTQEEWDALSPEDREKVYEALPDEVTYEEMAPPEGDFHQDPKFQSLEAIRAFFRSQKRKAFVRAEMPVYYPNAPRFAPDLLVVFDVEDHKRGKWVVSKEGRGLDWVLEIHCGGDRKKDAVRNVTRYAQLGIPEYFLFDALRNQLHAYRLPTSDARVYVPIVPQHGVYSSGVLGLDARVDGDRLRFFAGTAMLLDADELRRRLEETVDALMARADSEATRADEEGKLRQEEARLRQAAEEEVARLRAELEALKKQR
jgi:Uma2 family endonuclease